MRAEWTFNRRVDHVVYEYRDQFGVEPISSVIGFPVPTYYAAKKRAGAPSDREIRDGELIPLIREAWESETRRESVLWREEDVEAVASRRRGGGAVHG